MTLSLLSQTLWVIVGAQSGLARAFARRAAEAGAPMVLFARNADELAASKTDLLLRGSPYVETVQGDINDPAARQALVALVSNSPLPLGLYLAAAQMPDQAEMLANESLCAQMLATNFTSSVLLMNALLPLVAQRIGSSVVILSSVAGDRGRGSNFLYGATKAGLSAYAEGLAAHLSAHHIPLLLVKPGPIDTAMTWGHKLPPLPVGQPTALAEAIWQRLARRQGGTLYFPWFWKWVMLAIKLMPTRLFNKAKV